MLGLWACVCWYFPKLFKLVLLSAAIGLVCAAYVPLLYLVQTNAEFRTSVMVLAAFGYGVLITRISQRISRRS